MCKRGVGAGIGLWLVASVTQAGVPDTDLIVNTESTCSAPMLPSHSALNGANGGLTWERSFPLVEGVPGKPVVFTVLYSSALDDAGTHGSRLHLTVRSEDRDSPGHCVGWSNNSNFVPTSIGEASVEFDSGGAGVVGFGVAGSGYACNPARTGDIPFTRSATGVRRSGSNGDTYCPGGGDHDCATTLEAQVTLPFQVRSAMTSTQASYFYDPSPGCTATPPDPVSFDTTRQVVVARPAAGCHIPSNDPSYFPDDPCGQLLYVEGSADDSVARLGVNWEHSYAWRITRHADQGTDQVYVVEAPRGGRTIFVASGGLPTTITDSIELERSPRGSSCGCTDVRLFATHRAEALPDLTSDFDAFELVDPDGARMVFTRTETDGVPAGRLVRVEENYGRNPVGLSYTDGDLRKVVDSGDYYVLLTYDDVARQRRLVDLEFPGDRHVEFLYDGDTAKLIGIRDPVQAEDHGLDHTTFQYASSAGPDANDISCRTEPDGQAFDYTYVTSGPNAGRLESAVQTDECGGTPRHAYSYEHSTPDDDERWIKVIPEDTDTAPTLLYVLNGQGQLLRVEEQCTANCPIVASIDDADPVVTVVREYQYDGFGQPRAVRTYPIVDEGSGLVSRRGSHFAASCITRDGEQGRPTQLLGPTCVEEVATDVFESTDGWGEACDCDAWQRVHDQPDRSDCDDPAPDPSWSALSVPTPVGSAVLWEWDHAVGGLPEVEATFDRPIKVLGASQRTELGNPEAACAGVRAFYYPDNDEDSHPDGMVSAICPPTFTDTTPGLGCRLFTYETWTPAIGGEAVQVASVTDEAGNTWSFAYTANRQLEAITAPESDSQTPVTSLSYGADGRVEAMISPGDLATAWTYNARGQVTSVETHEDGADSQTTVYNYTAGGRLRQITELEHEPVADESAAVWIGYHFLGYSNVLRRGTIPRTSVDAAEILPFAGATTDEVAAPMYITVGRNANKDVVAWFVGQDSMGSFSIVRRTLLARDGFGNVTGGNWASGFSTDEDYSPVRDFCTTIDPTTGNTAWILYGLSPPDGSGDACSDTEGIVKETYEFDRAGRLSESVMRWAFDSSSTAQHSTCSQYDPWGRLSVKHDQVTSSGTGCDEEEAYRSVLPGASFGFDESDRAVDIAYASGGNSPYAEYLMSYDALGRMESMFESVTETDLQWTYRPDGLLKSIRHEEPAPVAGTMAHAFVLGYDDLLRLESVWEGDPESPSMTEGSTHLYEYDSFGRLSRATLSPNDSPTTPVFDWSYTYDADDWWNLASVEDLDASTTVRSFTSDEQDRLTDTGYEYHDWIGAVTEEPSSAGGRTFRWDTNGRLLAVLHDDEGTAYSYDPSGRLIAQRPVEVDLSGALVAAGTPSVHLWNGWRQVGTVDADSHVPDHSWSDAPIANVGIRDGSDPHEALYFDHQGTVRGHGTDPVLEPFGEVISGSIDLPAAFQGQEWHSESGLYYMRHRWYDPLTKRFLSREPLMGGPIQNYTFVEGAPTRGSDPSGLLPQVMEDRLYEALTAGGEVGLLDAAIDLMVECATLDASRSDAMALRDVEVDFDRVPRGESVTLFHDRTVDRVALNRSLLRATSVPSEIGFDVTADNGRTYTINTPPQHPIHFDWLIVSLGHEASHVFDLPCSPSDLDPFSPYHQTAYDAGFSILQQLWNNPDCGACR